jgi:glyoxylase-like metal-dependent hydrolase (beta-lactamase superfamily II)
MLHISTFRCNNFYENTYVLFDDKGDALILDPGMYSSAERSMVDKHISWLGLSIRYVVLTHAHIDHMLGLAYVMQRYAAPLIVHPSEYRNLELLRTYGLNTGYQLDKVPDNIVFTDEGEEIVSGELRFSVLVTPGHTPYSISLYCADKDILFSGDILYANAIGNTSLPGGNQQQLIDTLHDRILPLPEKTVFYPGHGPVSTIGYVRESLKDGYFNNYNFLPLL